ADLLVLADISQLYAISLEGHALGAVSWNKIAESNDRSFFEQLGMSTEAPYFNAGVLLIDANQWRKSNIGPRCFEVLDRYGAALPTMDQTVLNLVFYKSFFQLPRRFNTPVTASRPPLARSVVASRVIHLVAYPKPWDAFGFLNGQFELFQFWFRQTAYRGKRPSMLHMRNVRKIKAILKCLPNLLRARRGDGG
ncbi:MAG: glycosyltransferase, partial [Candidatus Methanomethylicaceae archaeon]